MFKKIHTGEIGNYLFMGLVLAVMVVSSMGMYSVMSAYLTGITDGFLPNWFVPSVISIMTFSGGLWVYLYSEYTMEDIKAYVEEHNEGNFRVYVGHFGQIIFLGLDIFGVGYRAQFVPASGRGWVIAATIAMVLVPFVIGKMLFASANRPKERVMTSTKNKAVSRLEVKLDASLNTMSAADLLLVASGDGTPFKLIEAPKQAALDFPKALPSGGQSQSQTPQPDVFKKLSQPQQQQTRQKAVQVTQVPSTSELQS